MGAVYRVRDRRLNRILVAKTVLLDSAGPQEQRELRERFRREAELASRLAHPNIVQIHDLVPEGPWIVMEFVEGPTLRDLLERGPLAVGLALEIARQTLRALSYLHARGAIHRDIAPDNLMLTRDPEGAPLVKLIDLGIARSVSDDGLLTGKGVFLGKPSYASPEHLKAVEPAGVASDIFSFGVVLYELLTGLHPFAGRASSSRHRHPSPLAFAVSDPAGRIPDDLRAIVARALEEEPQRRFAGAEELASRLSAVQSRFPCGAGEVDAVLGAFSPGPPIAFPVGKGGPITRPSLDRIPLVHPPTPPGARPAPAVVRKRTPPQAKGRVRGDDGFSRRMAVSIAVTVLGVLLAWPLFDRLQGPPRPSPRPSPITAKMGRSRAEAKEARMAAADQEETALSSPDVLPEVADAAASLPQAPSPLQPEPVPAVLKSASPDGAATPRSTELAPEPAPARQAPSPEKGKEERSALAGGEEFFDTEPAVLLAVPRVASPRGVKSGRAEVVIGFWVDTAGAVSDARVELSHVEGQSPASFEESALAAARKARFRPAQRKGRPVDSWNTLTFTFDASSAAPRG